MKFTINSDILKSYLRIANSIVSANPSNEVAEAFYLEAKDGKLIIKSTNMSVEINLKVACDVEDEGSVIVKADLLTSYISKIKDNDIDFVFKDGQLRLTDGKNKVQIPVFSTEQFPAQVVGDTNTNFTMSGEIFQDIVDKTSFVIPNNPNNQILGTLLINAKNSELEAVATDTFHLSYYNVNMSIDRNSTFTINKDVLGIISKMDISNQNLKFKSGNNNLTIEGDNFRIITQYISGKFPKYETVLPDNDFDMTSLISKDNLVSSIDKALVMCGDTRTISLDFEPDELTITNIDKNLGHFEDKLDHNLAGDSLDINIDGHNLLQAVKRCPNDVEISLNEGVSPLCIKDDSWTYILMPIRK